MVNQKRGSVFPSEPQGHHLWKGAVIRANEVTAVRAALVPSGWGGRGNFPCPSEARLCQLLQGSTHSLHPLLT